MVSNQEKVMIIRKKKCCKPRKKSRFAKKISKNQHSSVDIANRWWYVKDVYKRQPIPDFVNTTETGGISKMAGLTFLQGHCVNIMVHGGLWKAEKSIMMIILWLSMEITGTMSMMAKWHGTKAQTE